MQPEIDVKQQPAEEKKFRTQLCWIFHVFLGWKNGWKTFALFTRFEWWTKRIKNAEHCWREQISVQLIHNGWTMSEIKKSKFHCYCEKLCSSKYARMKFHTTLFPSESIASEYIWLLFSRACWQFESWRESLSNKIVLELFEATMT